MKRLCLIAIFSAFLSLVLPGLASAQCPGCNQGYSFDAPAACCGGPVYKKVYRKPYKRRYRSYRRRSCRCTCTSDTCINPNYVYNPYFSCRGFYEGRWYVGYRVGYDSCDLLIEYGVTVRVYRFFPVL